MILKVWVFLMRFLVENWLNLLIFSDFWVKMWKNDVLEEFWCVFLWLLGGISLFQDFFGENLLKIAFCCLDCDFLIDFCGYFKCDSIVFNVFWNKNWSEIAFFV
jgi:hypothetical protein